jgi:2,4-diketo-3-deoxy-L-fuconate hydrolase
MPDFEQRTQFGIVVVGVVRLVGFDDAGDRMLGVMIGDGVVPMAPAAQCYHELDRWLPAAAKILEQAPEPAWPIDSLVLAPPVPPGCRVLGVGLNYRRHAAETAKAAPTRPEVFVRFGSTLVGHGATVPLPPAEPALDYEGELAVVVGRPLYGATVEQAERSILGWTCFLDLTARGYQAAGSQWALAKNAERSGPIGPWIVTADELGDGHGLHLATRVNGEVLQAASTAEMMFSPAEVLAYVSGVMRIEPGDVLATGTPEGVGVARQPPRLLQVGDEVAVTIERVGTLAVRIAPPATTTGPEASTTGPDGSATDPECSTTGGAPRSLQD